MNGQTNGPDTLFKLDSGILWLSSDLSYPLSLAPHK